MFFSAEFMVNIRSPSSLHFSLAPAHVCSSCMFATTLVPRSFYLKEILSLCLNVNFEFSRTTKLQWHTILFIIKLFSKCSGTTWERKDCMKYLVGMQLYLLILDWHIHLICFYIARLKIKLSLQIFVLFSKIILMTSAINILFPDRKGPDFSQFQAIIKFNQHLNTFIK